MGLSEEEVKERVYEAIKLVGIGADLLTKSPFELSGGQKRRVAIAGVISMRPKVLILDEPTAGLDPHGRDEILSQLLNMHQKRADMTVIFVSHSMEDVANYVQRIIVMNDGEVALDDVPKRVFRYAKELDSIGLAVPQVTAVMNSLREAGIPTGKDATTVEEARDELLKIYVGGCGKTDTHMEHNKAAFNRGKNY
jgi:energy-coupling factor transport system ATP-binding protein